MGLNKYTPHLRKNDYVGALSWCVENASIRAYFYGNVGEITSGCQGRNNLYESDWSIRKGKYMMILVGK